MDRFQALLDLNPEKYGALIAQKRRQQEQALGQPTPYKISTQSAKCRIGIKVNLEKLVQKLTKNEVVHGWKYKKYNGGTLTRTEPETGKKTQRNQVTLKVPTKKGDNMITVQLYQNGSISMTGCKTKKNGVEVARRLMKHLKDISHAEMYQEITKILEKKTVMADLIVSHLKRMNDDDIYVQGNITDVTDFSITMINCNYNYGPKCNINNLKLYQLIKNKFKGIFCSYEPDKYQAVKIYYMYNTMNKVQTGICLCDKDCKSKRKRTGSGPNNCKKVTIAVFRTGSVIITGGNCKGHVESAYNFMNELMKNHYLEIAN